MHSSRASILYILGSDNICAPNKVILNTVRHLSDCDVSICFLKKNDGASIRGGFLGYASIISPLKCLVFSRYYTFIHVNTYRANLFGLVLKLLFRHPRVVATCHAVESLEANSYSDASVWFYLFCFWRNRVNRFCYNRFDLCIAVSSQVAQYLQSFGIKNSHVVRNGVSLSEVCDVIPSGVLRHRFDPLSPSFAQVGFLTTLKNPLYSLRLMAYMKSLGFSPEIHFFGSFGSEEGFEEKFFSYVEKYSLRDCVFIHGHVASSSLYLHQYKCSDFLLMPSLSEGLPLSMLESMVLGVLPVASRVGGIPELLESDDDNGHGFLFDLSDELSFEKIVSYIREVDFTASSFRSAKFAREFCSSSIQSRGYLDAYLSLM